MKILIIFTAIRVIEVLPQEGQSKEDAIQCEKEAAISDPFSFIDVGPDNIEVACNIVEIKKE